MKTTQGQGLNAVVAELFRNLGRKEAAAEVSTVQYDVYEDWKKKDLGSLYFNKFFGFDWHLRKFANEVFKEGPRRMKELAAVPRPQIKRLAKGYRIEPENTATSQGYFVKRYE